MLLNSFSIALIKFQDKMPKHSLFRISFKNIKRKTSLSLFEAVHKHGIIKNGLSNIFIKSSNKPSLKSDKMMTATK